VEEHLPLVHRIAARRSPRQAGVADYDDLYAEGVIALIEAEERFDETRGVPFDAWACIRVAGAVVNYLRKLEWGNGARRNGRDVPKLIGLDDPDGGHERIGGRHRLVDERLRRF